MVQLAESRTLVHIDVLQVKYKLYSPPKSTECYRDVNLILCPYSPQRGVRVVQLAEPRRTLVHIDVLQVRYKLFSPQRGVRVVQPTERRTLVHIDVLQVKYKLFSPQRGVRVVYITLWVQPAERRTLGYDNRRYIRV